MVGGNETTTLRVRFFLSSFPLSFLLLACKRYKTPNVLFHGVPCGRCHHRLFRSSSHLHHPPRPAYPGSRSRSKRNSHSPVLSLLRGWRNARWWWSLEALFFLSSFSTVCSGGISMRDCNSPSKSPDPETSRNRLITPPHPPFFFWKKKSQVGT